MPGLNFCLCEFYLNFPVISSIHLSVLAMDLIWDAWNRLVLLNSTDRGGAMIVCCELNALSLAGHLMRAAEREGDLLSLPGGFRRCRDSTFVYVNFI